MTVTVFRLPAAAFVGTTVASAALAIAAAPWALATPWLAWAFKPLATLAIVAYAASRGAAPARRWIVAGLVLSLAGDVALLWPDRGFVPGLVAFLFAHLAYLVAFTRDTRLAARRAPFAAYAVVAGALLLVLWPGVPAALRGAVIAYVIALIAMAGQAAARWQAAGADARRLAARAAVGGALFVASDALLAFDRFVAPLPLASLSILATYWSAQWCIASALPPR